MEVVFLQMNNANSIILIDSHILLWLLDNPQKLGPKTIELVQGARSVLVSMASLWELAIKNKQGKLAYSPQQLTLAIHESGYDLLNIKPEHIIAYNTIELSHGDPFDTLLIAQSKAEGIVIITADKLLLATSYNTFNARF